MNQNETGGKVEQMVEQIQQFAAEMEDAENWMITVPVDSFDEVESRLDTDNGGPGTDFKGASLCYDQHRDEVWVEYSTPLSEYQTTRD